MSKGMITHPTVEQQTIFTHCIEKVLNLNGPINHLCVSAGAGAGKTSTIVHLAYLVPENIRNNCAFVAFAKDIAAVLAQRLPEGFNSSTTYSMLLKVCQNSFNVRRNRNYVTLNKYWTIAADMLLESDSEDMLENAAAYKRMLVEACEKCRLHLIDPSDDESWLSVIATHNLTTFVGMQDMVKAMIQKGLNMAMKGEAIDFTDMIYVPAILVKNGKADRLKLPAYDVLIVDECQDMNEAQRVGVLACLSENGRLIFVGDKDQSIFAFAGANTSSIELIKAAVSTSGYCEVLPLHTTFRCPKSHVKLANELVPTLKAADWAKEGFIGYASYDEAMKLYSAESEDMVLSRTTAPLITLLFEMVANRIPARLKGNDLGPIKVLANAIAGKRCNWLSFGEKIDAYYAKEVERMSKKRNGEMYLESVKDRVEALTVLWEQSLTAKVTNVKQFIDWIESALEGTNGKAVMLSTVHRAKGLEAERVFILDVTKMPHPMAKTEEDKQQERNIKYVALTRSKDTLYFVASKR